MRGLDHAVGRRPVLKGAAVAPLLSVPALRVRAEAKPLRIGVLTDMSSWGRDNGGPGSVYAANAAARDADVPNSAIAFAVSGLCKQKNRIALLSGAGSSELTNARCNDRAVQFTYNTYAPSKVTTEALSAQGAKTWFFITAHYTFGKQLEADATAFIRKAGGQVLGHALHPTGTSDLSSLLLQAQASRADVVALANAGSDCTNALK
jgi:branched-chain amino acid transport system substrate-binding protein